MVFNKTTGPVDARPQAKHLTFGSSTDPTLLALRRFRALTQASAQIVWIAEANGDILEDSPSWRAFTGQTLAEWRTDWIGAIHPDDQASALAHWSHAVALREGYETTYRMRRIGGEWRWMSVRGVPVYDHTGAVDCWVGLNDDITPRIEAEMARAESEAHFKALSEALRRERGERDRFVISLVHDLKNTFGASQSALALALDEGASPGDRECCRRILLNSMARTNRMITDLLDANALDAGHAYRPRSPGLFQVAGLFAEVADFCVRSRDVRIRLAVDDDLTVRGNRDDLARALENLLSNAAKYGDRTRTITLGARAGDAYVEMWVHNWGNPIADGDRAQIFGFLRRADDARESPGWGIGLTLVKGIVEGHGGTVAVASSVEHGTRFELRLPI